MTNESIPDREWMRLRQLQPGFVFVTLGGTLAVKSEHRMLGGKCMCIMLGSGEYAHFAEGDDTLVSAIEVSE